MRVTTSCAEWAAREAISLSAMTDGGWMAKRPLSSRVTHGPRLVHSQRAGQVQPSAAKRSTNCAQVNSCSLGSSCQSSFLHL